MLRDTLRLDERSECVILPLTERSRLINLFDSRRKTSTFIFSWRSLPSEWVLVRVVYGFQVVARRAFMCSASSMVRRDIEPVWRPTLISSLVSMVFAWILIRDKFKVVVNENVNKSVELTIYNSKTHSVRQVSLVPQEKWGGEVWSVLKRLSIIVWVFAQGLLGLTVQFTDFEQARERVWHVLDIQQHSPAALAGLRANADFILGGEIPMNDAEDFYALIDKNQGLPVKLYVYNTVTDKIRQVILTPNIGWGGEGSLGCGIGYGYLHRIPFCNAQAAPITKSNAGLINSDKGPLLASIPPPNMNFTFQPANMPPITISMPNISLPPLVDLNSTAVTMDGTQVRTESLDSSHLNQASW